MADFTKQSKNRLDRIAKRLFGFFASNGCRMEFYNRPRYRVLNVFHRNQDRLRHVYYGCFPKDCPDAECMRELVRDLAHILSGQFEGRPVMAFGFLGLGGIHSLEELEIKLDIMGHDGPQRFSQTQAKPGGNLPRKIHLTWQLKDFS